MGFTTVSLADLLWLFLVGLLPLSLFALLSLDGETQIWLGDLRLAFCSVGFAFCFLRTDSLFVVTLFRLRFTWQV